MLQLVIFFFVLVVGIVCDLFLWNTYMREWPVVWQMLHFVPSVVLALSLTYMGIWGMNSHVFRMIFIVLLCCLLPKLLFAVFVLLARWLVLMAPMLHLCGLLLALVVGVTCFYGLMWGWKHLVVRPQTLTFTDLPEAFDGFRIVQISDLHLEMFGGGHRFVQALVDSVNSREPDLIVFTGDLVSRQSQEIVPYVDDLSRLRARHGVISVLGNHDYGIYGPFRADTVAVGLDRKLNAKLQRQMGWDILLNEHRFVEQGGDSIAVIGVENQGQSGRIREADLPKAMQGVPDDMFKLLLTHDPWHWRHEVIRTTDIQLTLAGHTHASHFRVGRYSPSRMIFREWGGLYRVSGQQLFVSAGIGGMLSFRLGAWPEVNVITLRRKR